MSEYAPQEGDLVEATFLQHPDGLDGEEFTVLGRVQCNKFTGVLTVGWGAMLSAAESVILVEKGESDD